MYLNYQISNHMKEVQVRSVEVEVEVVGSWGHLKSSAVCFVQVVGSWDYRKKSTQLIEGWEA